MSSNDGKIKKYIVPNGMKVQTLSNGQVVLINQNNNNTNANANNKIKIEATEVNQTVDKVVNEARGYQNLQPNFIQNNAKFPPPNSSVQNRPSSACSLQHSVSSSAHTTSVNEEKELEKLLLEADKQMFSNNKQEDDMTSNSSRNTSVMANTPVKLPEKRKIDDPINMNNHQNGLKMMRIQSVPDVPNNFVQNHPQNFVNHQFSAGPVVNQIQQPIVQVNANLQKSRHFSNENNNAINLSTALSSNSKKNLDPENNQANKKLKLSHGKITSLPYGCPTSKIMPRNSLFDNQTGLIFGNKKRKIEALKKFKNMKSTSKIDTEAILPESIERINDGKIPKLNDRNFELLDQILQGVGDSDDGAQEPRYFKARKKEIQVPRKKDEPTEMMNFQKIQQKKNQLDEFVIKKLNLLSAKIDFEQEFTPTFLTNNLSKPDYRNQSIFSADKPEYETNLDLAFNSSTTPAKNDDKNTSNIVLKFAHHDVSKIHKTLEKLNNQVKEPIIPYFVHPTKVQKLSYCQLKSIKSKVKKETDTTSVRCRPIIEVIREQKSKKIMVKSHETCAVCKFKILGKRYMVQQYNNDVHFSKKFCSSLCMAAFEYQNCRFKRENETSDDENLIQTQNYQPNNQQTCNLENILMLFKDSNLKTQELSKIMAQKEAQKSGKNGKNSFFDSRQELINKELAKINYERQSVPYEKRPGYKTFWIDWCDNFIQLNFNLSPRLLKDETRLSDQSYVNKLSKKYDNRICCLCRNINYHNIEIENAVSRLLMVDKDQYVHINCCKWSTNIQQKYSEQSDIESENLSMPQLEFSNFENVYKNAVLNNCLCYKCKNPGASLKCYVQKCNKWYHFPCALKNGNLMFIDNSMCCPEHIPTNLAQDDIIKNFNMFVCATIKRDIPKQISNIISNGELIYNHDHGILPSVENRMTLTKKRTKSGQISGMSEDSSLSTYKNKHESTEFYEPTDIYHYSKNNTSNYVIKYGSYSLHRIGRAKMSHFHDQAQNDGQMTVFPVGYRCKVAILDVTRKAKDKDDKNIPDHFDNVKNRNEVYIEDNEKDPLNLVHKFKINSSKQQRRFVYFEICTNDLIRFDNQNFTSIFDFYDYFRKLNDTPTWPSYKINARIGLGHYSGIETLALIESLPNLYYTFPNYRCLIGKTSHYDKKLSCNHSGSFRTEPWNRKLVKQNPRLRENSGANMQRVTEVNTQSNTMDDRLENHNSLQAILRESGIYNATEITASLGLENISDGIWGNKNKMELYRKMKKEWRLNSKLNRSQIQGLGLYARRDIDPGTFIIEYTGELIRKDMTDARENYYDQIGKGTYMFRLSDEYVIDATIVGGAARYINHNCDPNCVAETVNIEGKEHIIIISNRFIFQGEELCYDYKFDVADDGVTERVACLCRAVNCRKWMN